jgi:hypothetical protein
VSAISKARRFFRSPCTNNIIDVHLDTDYPTGPSDWEFAESSPRELYHLVRTEKPRPQPSLHIGGNLDQAGDLYDSRQHLGVKEIVLGIDSDQLFMDTLSAMSKVKANRSVPSLFQFEDSSPALRLLPSAFSAMVLHVQDLDTAQSKLEQANLYGGRVGHNGISVGQVAVAAAPINGLDIRLCENLKYTPQFDEPEEAIYSGTIPDLQGTEENLKLNKLHEINGNCWMEFRSMVKLGLGITRRS